MKTALLLCLLLTLGASPSLAELHHMHTKAWVVTQAKDDTSVTFRNADVKTGEVICSWYPVENQLRVLITPKLLRFIAVGDTIRPGLYHDYHKKGQLGAAVFAIANTEITVKSRVQETPPNILMDYRSIWRGHEIRMMANRYDHVAADTLLPDTMGVRYITFIAIPAQDTFEVVCRLDSVDGSP